VQTSSNRLLSEDLAPAKARRWKAFDLSTMWMSVVHNLGMYSIAAGFYVLGMSPLAILFAYLAAFFIMFVFSNLMGIMGQRAGVPFPVIARLSFGVFGANIPAMLRGIVAVFWYGIQTYLAANALIVVLRSVYPVVGEWEQHAGSFLGLSTVGWIAFLLVWGLQLFVVTHGMERVRKFQNLAGPIIWVVMIVLAIILLTEANWNISLTEVVSKPESDQGALALFGLAVFSIISSQVSVTTNIADFCRFSPSAKSVRWGNFWGLPVNGAAFGIAAVLCTAAAKTVYGQTFTDPVDLIAHQGNKLFVIIAALLFLGATMGTNIAANIVSPAYDFANLFPSKVNFSRGAVIASVLALLTQPWNIFSSPVIVVYFLGAMGACTGPMMGIILWDYYRIRKGRVDIRQLYSDSKSSSYYYHKGFNPYAIITLVSVSVVAASIALVPVFSAISPYAWPIGLVLGAAVYALICRNYVVPYIPEEDLVTETEPIEVVPVQPSAGPQQAASKVADDSVPTGVDTEAEERPIVTN
jgi:NCS1 family nucleobase:cation symporter-1